MRRAFSFLIVALLVLSFVSFSQTEFSQEKALEFLSVLVNEIGPRPMGSPNEQLALGFAVAKFREFGCDDAYVMPMKVAGETHTSSGVAIGVKRGTSGRIIIIGGHIDTSGPDVPGANDDGSGTACVIELARIIAKRQTSHTVLFCCWGGEEDGLRGAKHFVDTFADIDSVEVMIQLDMADGGGPLLVEPNGSTGSTPQWLVEKAFDIAHRELGYNDVVYWTQVSTMNRVMHGAFGSDHVAFLDKGIPAIDFTSDVNRPIHVPQDSWENFVPSGLKRSGDIALKLFEHLDGIATERGIDHYLLFQFGSALIFLPYWFLWTIISLSLVLTGLAFSILQKHRTPLNAAAVVRWSGFKILMFWLLIQTFIWLSEAFAGTLFGYRFPWVNNFTGYWALGIVSGVLGLWCVLQFTRRFRLTGDAFVYCRVAIILFAVFTVLASVSTPEFGVYFAVSSAFVAWAFLIQSPVPRLLLFLAGFLVIYKLVFFEAVELFQRLLTMNQVHSVTGLIMYEATFIVVYTLIFLPFAYAFIGLHKSSGVDLIRLRWLKTNTGFALILGTAILLLIVLSRAEVYDRFWYDRIMIEEELVNAGDSSRVVIQGSEDLDGVSMNAFGEQSIIDGEGNYKEFSVANGIAKTWASVERTTGESDSSSTDSTFALGRTMIIHSVLSPLRVTVSYRSALPYKVVSEWEHKQSRQQTTFSWYAFPEMPVTLHATFEGTAGQKIVEEVRLRYDSLASPVRLSREFSNVSYRTSIVLTDTITISSGHHPVADLAR